ncbi:signal peptidase I [Tessaracoccus palaemonis]|uniref:Signal peptidase I n=1 Tax=Tessaracoccus palaemonis TaxID=2829499 RepID=A0ABX8SNP9_9ACTN|nr:signal peptidase I [Tessaracoccus palaemonis]
MEGVLVVVGAIVIATLIRTFVGQMFVIPSGSMENTLQVNDRVLVAKFGGFQRGDVVVFEDPGNWLTPVTEEPNAIKQALEFVGVLPNSGTEHLIKRVIGMPGDHVRTTDDGSIEVNGQVLDETSYLYAQDGVQVAPSTVPFDIVVPADHIFVMGDHRNASNDSRCRLADVSQNPGESAFVPIENVVGASVAIVAPLDRLATFQLPSTYETVPDATEPAPEDPELIHVESGC